MSAVGFQGSEVGVRGSEVAVRGSWLGTRGLAWAILAAGAATIPFVTGLTGSRIFYIRDLSLYFWGRYLWLRRTLLSGEWPLWDPYVGGGQSAVSDALHQLFLLPVLLIRLLGTEVLGFNLWVALPFPAAALGAYGFFARRFSGPASALGAIAFTLSGPIVSTGNFPNMSWSVAAMPWVLWAADRVVSVPTRRSAALLALAVAFQALAGEPVTLCATLVLTAAFGVVFAPPASNPTGGERLRRWTYLAAGLLLGMLLAAIQLVPLAQAATLAERSTRIGRDLWSLQPLALIETVALHIFGDYYTSPSLASVPWLRVLNTGREPFFFSIYFGVPLLTLAIFGLVASSSSRWGLFWVIVGAASLIGAFGSYTPIYPFLRDHLPVLGSFRFPVKYLVVFAMSVAAGAAAAWDGMRRCDGPHPVAADFARGRFIAVSFAFAVGLGAYIVSAACIYFTTPTAFKFLAIAKWLGADDPVAAAEFMIKALPRQSTTVMLIGLSAAALTFFATAKRPQAPHARLLLYALVVGDLLVRAWGINPTFDPAYLAEAEWLSRTKSHAEARFYIGGKRDGTLDPSDPDSSRAFRNAPGLIGSASRAALSGQAVFYPSAWHGREMLSYDLAVLWPREFEQTTKLFLNHGRDARDLFLDRTGVRYRVLPDRLAAGRAPLVQVPYFLESYLYDWGAQVGRRAEVVSDFRIVPDVEQQLEALFQPGWNSQQTVLLQRESPAAGDVGAPQSPSSRIVSESSNRVVVEAAAPTDGAYLLLLDSFSEDWRATVDGRPAGIVRANGLFRAVHLVPGRHVVEFDYRPRAFVWGSAISLAALLAILWLLLRERPTVRA